MFFTEEGANKAFISFFVSGVILVLLWVIGLLALIDGSVSRVYITIEWLTLPTLVAAFLFWLYIFVTGLRDTKSPYEQSWNIANILALTTIASTFTATILALIVKNESWFPFLSVGQAVAGVLAICIVIFLPKWINQRFG